MHVMPLTDIATWTEQKPRRWATAWQPPLHEGFVPEPTGDEGGSPLPGEDTVFSVLSQSLKASADTDHPSDQSSRSMLATLRPRFTGCEKTDCIGTI